MGRYAMPGERAVTVTRQIYAPPPPPVVPGCKNAHKVGLPEPRCSAVGPEFGGREPGACWEEPQLFQ